MWTWIGIACVAVGIVLIWSVLVKKFPQLKLIDLSTLAKERHAQVKARIMHERFDRSMGAWRSKTAALTGAVSGGISGFYRGLHGRLKQLERTIDREKPLSPDELAARIAALVDEAAADAVAERYGMAEERYIEILRVEPKHAEAYRGLSDVYVAQKQYDQARQTLEYLLSLDAEDERAIGRLGALEAIAGNYEAAEARYLASIGLAADPALYRAELGELYLAAGEAGKAHEQFRLALQAEPYNPRYLDYFIETSILIGDAKSADEAFEVLETANPENQKLADFRERIDAMRQPETV